MAETICMNGWVYSNITKRRSRGQNIIGWCAIVEVPGQHGGNVTLCAVISHHGVLHHHATLGPYNTQHLVDFLKHLYGSSMKQEIQDGPSSLSML